MSPVLHHCVVIFLLVLRYHGLYVVYILKIEFRSCARGANSVASFITTDEPLQ